MLRLVIISHRRIGHTRFTFSYLILSLLALCLYCHYNNLRVELSSFTSKNNSKTITNFFKYLGSICSSFLHCDLYSFFPFTLTGHFNKARTKTNRLLTISFLLPHSLVYFPRSPSPSLITPKQLRTPPKLTVLSQGARIAGDPQALFIK